MVTAAWVTRRMAHWEVRAAEVLKRLPDGPVTGAEVGVFSGRMSRALLRRPYLFLIMVDSWEGDGAAYLEPGDDWHAALTQEQQARYMAAALANTDFAYYRRLVIRKRWCEAAEEIKASALDFVFLDADHSLDGTREALEASLLVLKSGGLLGGHDYGHPRWPGVKTAVDTFVTANGWPLELGDDMTWFARRKC